MTIGAGITTKKDGINHSIEFVFNQEEQHIFMKSFHLQDDILQGVSSLQMDTIDEGP